jgi:hypothetical protein
MSIIPKSSEVTYTQWLQAPGRAIVTADWHVPYWDDNLLEQLVVDGRHYHQDTLIGAGDLTQASAFYKKKLPKGLTTNELNSELRSLGEVIRYLASEFKELYLCPGNHDDWVLQAMGYTVTFRELLAMVVQDDKVMERIFTTERPFMLIGDSWVACHPDAMSKDPTAVAVRLATEVYPTKNVMIGHVHGMGLSVRRATGQQCIALGGLFDVEKLAYVWVYGAKLCGQMTNGYWILDDGIVIPRTGKTYEISNYTK